MKKIAFIIVVFLSGVSGASTISDKMTVSVNNLTKNPLWGIYFTVGSPTFVPSMTMIISIQIMCEYLADQEGVVGTEKATNCADAVNHPGYGSSVGTTATQVFVTELTFSFENKEVVVAAKEDAAIYLASDERPSISAVLQDCFSLLDENEAIAKVDNNMKAKIVLAMNSLMDTSH